VVTRGVGLEPRLEPRGCTPTVAIIVGPWLHLVDPKQERGMKVRTSTWRRIPPECLDPRIKSLNYLNIILARMDATAAGADDGLMLDLRGCVSEGPGYNVFAARDGVLSTPRDNILEGITRQTIFEICAREGIPVEVRDLWLYDLYTADEVFFCSSSVAVVGVVELDGRRIGAGAPGPLTRRLYDLFMRELTEGDDLTVVFP
ncbi:MAG TPA: aminotransferase class IV, partial [Dehalococcoidia bacterium]|nr:aminotransferase class IV [Dehalococcoidia bacterium]